MKKETNVIFIGRLAEYRYYNMDAVVRRALDAFEAMK
jgi:UDP-galactopyranose mutase